MSLLAAAACDLLCVAVLLQHAAAVVPWWWGTRVSVCREEDVSTTPTHIHHTHTQNNNFRYAGVLLAQCEQPSAPFQQARQLSRAQTHQDSRVCWLCAGVLSHTCGAVPLRHFESVSSVLVGVFIVYALCCVALCILVLLLLPGVTESVLSTLTTPRNKHTKKTNNSGVYDPLIAVRGVLQYFAPFYAACNVLLLVLCVMQCVWFAAVMR